MTSAREDQLTSKERKSDVLDMNDPKLRILKSYHDLQPKESVRKILFAFIQLKLNKQKVIEKFIAEAKKREGERWHKTPPMIRLDDGYNLCIPSNFVQSKEELEVFFSKMFYMIEFPYKLAEELFKNENERRAALVNLLRCLDDRLYISPSFAGVPQRNTLDQFIRALGLSCLTLLIEHQRWKDFKFHNDVMHEINPYKHSCARQEYDEPTFEKIFHDLIRTIPDHRKEHKENSNEPLSCLRSLCINYQFFKTHAPIDILAIADQLKKPAALEVLVNRFIIDTCLAFAYAKDVRTGRVTNFNREQVLQFVNAKFKTSLVQLFDAEKYDEVNQFLNSCGEFYLKYDRTWQLFIEALRESKRKVANMTALLETDFRYQDRYFSQLKLMSQGIELSSARMFSPATGSPESKEAKQIKNGSAAQARKA